MDQWQSRSVCVGPTILCANVRGHEWFGDVPAAIGGHDTAMIPPEGLLAALGNCMGMVIALTCQARGVPYEGMTLEVTADVIEEEKRLDNFRLTIRMPQALDDKGRRAVEIGESLCKVRGTLLHGAKVEVVLAE